jgi:excisionase family DNA binding protein
MSEFLTTRQLAERLQVSPETIRDWARKGRIPVIRVNAKIRRYDLAAVLASLREADQQKGVSHG